MAFCQMSEIFNCSYLKEKPENFDLDMCNTFGNNVKMMLISRTSLLCIV